MEKIGCEFSSQRVYYLVTRVLFGCIYVIPSDMQVSYYGTSHKK